jgi:hypothetical protein
LEQDGGFGVVAAVEDRVRGLGFDLGDGGGEVLVAFFDLDVAVGVGDRAQRLADRVGDAQAVVAAVIESP